MVPGGMAEFHVEREAIEPDGEFLEILAVGAGIREAVSSAAGKVERAGAEHLWVERAGGGAMAAGDEVGMWNCPSR